VSPLDAYYLALDAGDVEATVACFTEDAVYIRPQIDGPGLELVRGHDDLRAFFVARGKRQYRHYVGSHTADGLRCFLEGTAGIEGEPPTHVFLAHATVEPDGRISRYLALMAEAPGGWNAG
jgi:ketosteroid isomerase-like protein